MSRKENLDIVWSTPALIDFEKIIQYYAQQDSIFADQLRGAIYHASQSLSSFPDRGRVIPELQTQGVEKFREILPHPYRLMHMVEKKNIVITALFDARRDLEELIFERMNFFK